MLSDDFGRALAYASRLHIDQVRKGSKIPYISHLMAVTAFVLEDGADENVAIAALLHDAVEDQGGQSTLDEIKREFGSYVAQLVDALSEDRDRLELPWLARKQRQLEKLTTASRDVLRIKAGDTLHNVLSLLDSWERERQRMWNRFNAGSCPVNQLWYYTEVTRLVSPLNGDSGLPRRLTAAVVELRECSRPICSLDHEHPAPS
jgi:(p)ppGpp synthase/HD superfamily hydrolase